MSAAVTLSSPPPPQGPTFDCELAAALARLRVATSQFLRDSAVRPLVALSPSPALISSVRFELALSSSATVKLY